MLNSISENSSVLFGPEPSAGTKLGQYVLVVKIGSGGMGQVWKAKHEPTDKPYAIKLLPPIIAANPDAWDHVRRNFDIVENLNHPHICAVKVLDRDPKYGPYLVMAHVEGMTLNKYRQGRTFTVEQVAALLKPVAEALDFAHSRNVIHRDIKHENIMVVLAEDQQTIVATYVIDFGLAAEVRTTITQFSQQSAPIAGTLRYMAPEIWRGRPAVAQTDQYALAVIAYELLAGNFPIDGIDRGIMREAVLNESIDAISGQSSNVNKILSKGLSKKPDERFVRGCAELIENLYTSTTAPPQPAKEYANTASEVAKDFDRQLRETELPELVLPSQVDPGNFATWQAAAESGDVDSQFVVGMSYLCGLGVTKNDAMAAEWLGKAIQSGHLPSCAIIGALTLGQEGENLGFKLLKRAADQGLPYASYWIGTWFGNSASATREQKQQAAMWYTKAISTGSLRAQYWLGEHVLKHEANSDLAKTTREAVELVTRAANAGFAPAQVSLGNYYFGGKYGLPQSDQEGVSWWRKAAEAGDVNSQYLFAACLYDGKGIQTDRALSAHWMKIAAENGLAEAQFELAERLLVGDGIDANARDALMWFERVGEQGKPGGMGEAAMMYHLGDGIPKNPERAAYWWKKGAEKSDPVCMYNLGCCYIVGKGVEKSRTTAIHWLRSAANSGEVDDAFEKLACLLWDQGGGSEKEVIESIECLRRAKSVFQKSDNRHEADRIVKQLVQIGLERPQLRSRAFSAAYDMD